jgi:hypothetical protein
MILACIIPKRRIDRRVYSNNVKYLFLRLLDSKCKKIKINKNKI